MDKLGSFAEVWSTVRNKAAEFFGSFSGTFEKVKAFFGRYLPARKEKETGEAPETLPPEDTPDAPQSKPVAVLKTVGLWLFRLRKVFMAIPVIWYSWKLASYNLQNLPEQVGLNLQADGTYAQLIDRNMAVYGPLGITAVCLVLMFCSRRARYPWAISAFTLVLPLLILLTNLYPQ